MRVDHSVRAAFIAASLGALAACSADRITGPSPPPPSADVAAPGQTATYDWHAGDAFLAALDPAFSPAVAEAANGDRVAIKGTGTLSIHPKSATGSGTFVHTNHSGVVLASGTFTVTGLLSFHSFGTSPQFPPTFNSGDALISVYLRPHGAHHAIKAILRVECTLAGSTVPPGLEEGINLLIPALGLNFNEQVSGNTLFVKTS